MNMGSTRRDVVKRPTSRITARGSGRRDASQRYVPAEMTQTRKRESALCSLHYGEVVNAATQQPHAPNLWWRSATPERPADFRMGVYEPTADCKICPRCRGPWHAQLVTDLAECPTLRVQVPVRTAYPTHHSCRSFNAVGSGSGGPCRPPPSENRLRSSSDRPARKCGGKCGRGLV
jgi:hypothetical protein